MSDAPEVEKGETRAIAVRERLITQAPSAMFDTAAFEHLNRVATVLARSGLVPKTLTHEGYGNDAQPLPLDVVVARCVLLADQAQRSGADVIAFIQSTSIINGRLMHEGKLVNAIAKQRIGAELRYRFGLWDTDHIVFPPMIPAANQDGSPVHDATGAVMMVPDESFLHGAGERLAVRVYDRLSPEDYVDGSVGLWKATRKDSPWSNPGNWPRQLRYRGAREWARAYDPGAMLGMMADGDEDLEPISYEPIRAEPVGLRARLTNGVSGAGISEGHVERETKRRGRPPKTQTEPHQVLNVALEPSNDGEKQEAADERPTSPAAPTGTASAPPAANEPATSDSATDASADIQEATFSPADTSSRSEAGENVCEGCAGPGEVYLMEGEPFVDGRRLTYRDGERFSSVGEQGAGLLKVYAQHAPPAEAAPAQPDIPDHMQAASIEQAQAETQEVHPPEFVAYQDAVNGAATFEAVVTAFSAFQKTPLWAAMSETQQNQVRQVTWGVVSEKPWAPQPMAHLTAFRLWIEAQDDPAILEQALSTFEDAEVFKSKSDAVKEHVRGAVAARLHRLEDELAA